MTTPELRAYYDSCLSLPLEEGQDFWVFGYGSLMWHPGFPHIEVQPATLEGYHRHFCVYSFHYRGTPDCPGLVLGLDHGGSCIGMAYKVPSAEAETALDYLFEREMISGVYHPGWHEITLQSGERVQSVTFVADREHEQYAGRLSKEQLVDRIMQGVGTVGPCTEYLENTVKHLQALSIRDEGLEELLEELEKVRRVP